MSAAANIKASKLPRNTVTLWLDGSEEEVVQNYKDCQAHLRYWIFCNAAFRVRVGSRVTYTTPLAGTFYYVIRYMGRYLVFVIQARTFWLVGFYGARGVFQMKLEDQESLYMDSPDCHLLNFYASYANIGEKNGPGATRLGLGAFRQAFTVVCNHRWTVKNEEDPKLRSSIGLVVVLLMESKFREVLLRCCQGMEDSSFGRLGVDWVSLMITNWGTLSKEALRSLVFSQYKMRSTVNGILKEKFSSMEEIFDNLFFLQVDAISEGMFAHEKLPPAPRSYTWCPVDSGKGDEDIPHLNLTATSGSQSKTTMKNMLDHKLGSKNRKRGSSGGWPEQKMAVRRKLGASGGGGVGGPPDVPNWFSNWSQLKKDDELKYVLLEAQELGLKVIKVPPPTMKFKDDASSKNVDKSRQKARSESESTLAPPARSNPTAAPASVSMGVQMSDVEDLRSHKFVSDSVITYYFEQLSSVDKVIIQPPSISQLLVNTPDPSEILENLCLDNRLVLFPVNNNPDIHRVDAGTYWSLLVYENLDTNRGARFIHHDSTMGQINSKAADRLVGVLRSILPNAATAPLMRGYTPVQQNGYDCAIYVMAVAAAICQWSTGDIVEGDWSQEVTREVTATSVSQLRVMIADAIYAILRGD